MGKGFSRQSLALTIELPNQYNNLAHKNHCPIIDNTYLVHLAVS